VIIPPLGTSQECIREAFAALLKGDTKERDRLCARAIAIAAAVEKVLAVDFYVMRNGTVIRTIAMARAVGALQ
jgi:uncharacterized DUF497 family protein